MQSRIRFKRGSFDSVDESDEKPRTRSFFYYFSITTGILGALFGAYPIISPLVTDEHALTVQILNRSTPLFSSAPSVRSNLSVSYKGKQIHQLRLWTFRVYSSGRKAVNDQSFRGPVTIHIPDTIIQPPNVAPKPTDLPITFSQSGDHDIQLQPTMLNAGEGATISVLADADPSSRQKKWDVKGHILDTPIRTQDLTNDRFKTMSVWAIPASVIAVILLGIAFISAKLSARRMEKVLTLALANLDESRKKHVYEVFPDYAPR